MAENRLDRELDTKEKKTRKSAWLDRQTLRGWLSKLTPSNRKARKPRKSSEVEPPKTIWTKFCPDGLE